MWALVENNCGFGNLKGVKLMKKMLELSDEEIDILTLQLSCRCDEL